MFGDEMIPAATKNALAVEFTIALKRSTCSLVLLLISGFPESLSAQSDVSAAARAELLLENARGTNPIMCELAMQSIDRRHGDWGSIGRVPDAITEHRALLEWAAREIEDADVVPVLVTALSDSDMCVRRMAARIFGRVRHPSVVEALERRLRGRDERARQMAAVALGYVERRESVSALLDVLDDDVAAVRAAAAWALGAIEDERAIAALTELLRNDPDAAVRRQAAWALGNMF